MVAVYWFLVRFWSQALCIAHSCPLSTSILENNLSILVAHSNYIQKVFGISEVKKLQLISIYGINLFKPKQLPV